MSLSIVVNIFNIKIWLWSIYPAYSELWEQLSDILKSCFY